MWSSQSQALPEGTSFKDENWVLSCDITQAATGLPGKIAKRNKKEVRVTIINRNKEELVRDIFELKAATLSAQFKFGKDESEVIAHISEQGNQFAEDHYNKDLMESGPRFIQSRVYRINPSSGKYDLFEIKQKKSEQAN